MDRVESLKLLTQIETDIQRLEKQLKERQQERKALCISLGMKVPGEKRRRISPEKAQVIQFLLGQLLEHPLALFIGGVLGSHQVKVMAVGLGPHPLLELSFAPALAVVVRLALPLRDMGAGAGAPAAVPA